MPPTFEDRRLLARTAPAVRIGLSGRADPRDPPAEAVYLSFSAAPMAACAAASLATGTLNGEQLT